MENDYYRNYSLPIALETTHDKALYKIEDQVEKRDRVLPLCTLLQFFIHEVYKIGSDHNYYHFF